MIDSGEEEKGRENAMTEEGTKGSQLSVLSKCRETNWKADLPHLALFHRKFSPSQLGIVQALFTLWSASNLER